MSLEEIEAFANSLRTCPKCGSNEGFWLAANREKSYAQCKHCGAILEFCEVLSYSDKPKPPSKNDSKSAFRKLRFQSEKLYNHAIVVKTHLKNLLTIINPLVELMIAFSLSPLQVKIKLSSNSIKTLAALLNIYHVSIYDCILLISGSAILLLGVSGHKQCLPKASEVVMCGFAQTLITVFWSVPGLIMLGGVIWIFFPQREL